MPWGMILGGVPTVEEGDNLAAFLYGALQMTLPVPWR